KGPVSYALAPLDPHKLIALANRIGFGYLGIFGVGEKDFRGSEISDLSGNIRKLLRHALSKFSRAVRGPFIHEQTALLEKVATSIRGFDLIPDGVGKRHFSDLAGEVG